MQPERIEEVLRRIKELCEQTLEPRNIPCDCEYELAKEVLKIINEE